MITERRQLSYPSIITSTKQFWSSKSSMISPGILLWVKSSVMVQSTHNLADRARTINSNADLPSGNEVGAPGVDIGVPAQELSHGEFVLVAWDDVPASISKSNCIVVDACFCVSLAWKPRYILCSHSQNSVIFQAVASTSTLVVSTATEAPREATPRRHAMFLMVIATILDLVWWIFRTVEMELDFVVD